MMVSQNFMNILHQQPQYSRPSSSRGSSTESSDVQNPLQTIKKEIDDDDDDHMTTPSTSSYASNLVNCILEPVENIKEENEVVIKQEIPDVIKVEENNSSDWTDFYPKTREDKEVPTLPNKRIRKKKIIYDPSDSSHPVPKTKLTKKRKMALWKTEYEILTFPSETRKPFPDIQSMDLLLNKSKKEWEEDPSCQYCGKCITRFDYWRLHLMRHTGETPHKCRYCGKGYRARWRLTQHVRTHTRQLPYQCPHCNYRGNRSDYLASHINRKHKNLLKNDGEKVEAETAHDDDESSDDDESE